MFLIIPDSVMNSHIYWMKAFIRLEVSIEVSLWFYRCFKHFKRSAEFSYLLLSSQWYFFSGYNSKWSRCFWASQILRWILTSSGWRLLCDLMSLLSSQFDWINVLDILKVLLNFQIYCLVVNDPSLQLIIASEVDVFEPPRFCDVDEGFYATGSLCWGLNMSE